MLVPTSVFRNTQALARRRVVILGSTGSIGQQSLAVLAENMDKFEVYALAAGSNYKLLLEQANRFRPKYIALACKEAVKELKKEIDPGLGIEILDNDTAVEELAADPEADIVLAAIVGMAGLRGVIAAIDAGKQIALANKESLVVAGELVTSMMQRSVARIIPVDSEHSALFQTLLGEQREDVESLILTASGGPFLNTAIETFSKITPEEAVRHPCWSMGAKISVDSATMFNKGLELIEARWLFDLPQEMIEVLVHPQSIVHSIVRFIDGSAKVQASVPDMRAAISFALAFPGRRIKSGVSQLKLAEHAALQFIELDQSRFKGVALARQALRAGGTAAAVFNIADEIAVDLFLKGKITFTAISKFVEEALSRFVACSYSSLAELIELEKKMRSDLSRV